MLHGIEQLHDGTGRWAMSGPSTIYIVDDDEGVRDSLKLLLEAHGFRVEDYRSIREFLGAFRREEHQCLVLDHHLRGENGVDFLESADGATLDLPVIVMTAGGNAELRTRAEKAGARGYFSKPLDDCALVATLFKLLDPIA